MPKESILCVANWDSNVGYAWWLMESFWAKIGEHFIDEFEVIVAYPSISKIPDVIDNSVLTVANSDFTFDASNSIVKQLGFIRENRVKVIYLSDRAFVHRRYFLYKLAGVKHIIVHDHTPGLRTKPGNLKFALKRLFNRLPMFAADGAIGATEFVKQRLIEVNGIPRKACFAAPNGIPKKTNGTSRETQLLNDLGIPEDCKVIVSVGRANLYKGIDFALEVIKVLVHELESSQAHFLYVGDGPHLELVGKMAEDLGVSEHVTLPGRVNGIASLLDSCHVAFHPSKGEVGYSLSILEYMQAGLPVVVSDNPSVCEATTDEVDGLVYTEGDIYAAANKLHSILNDQQLVEQMGKAGQLKVNNQYSLERCHQALIGSIKSILEFR